MVKRTENCGELQGSFGINIDYSLNKKLYYFRFYGDNNLNKPAKTSMEEVYPSNNKHFPEPEDYDYEYIYVYDDDYQELKELTTSSDLKPWSGLSHTLSPQYNDDVIITENDMRNTGIENGKIEMTVTAGVGPSHVTNIEPHDMSNNWEHKQFIQNPTQSPFHIQNDNSKSAPYSVFSEGFGFDTTTEPNIRWGSVTLAPATGNPLWGKAKEIMKSEVYSDLQLSTSTFSPIPGSLLIYHYLLH